MKQTVLCYSRWTAILLLPLPGVVITYYIEYTLIMSDGTEVQLAVSLDSNGTLKIGAPESLLRGQGLKKVVLAALLHQQEISLMSTHPTYIR